MKYAALLLLAASLSACETSEEDRFFYKGWLHPEKEANRRIYGVDPDHMNGPQSDPARGTQPPPL